MSVSERDSYTGHMTTGHEWDGIKELNTPVPWPVIGCLTLAFLFSVGYWIMMPAFPLINSYTRGITDFDERDFVTEQIAQAKAERAVWEDRIDQESFEDIEKDSELMAIVQQTGARLYQDNCAVCHGSRGQGGHVFPNLRDNDWLWDNSPESIAHTLRVGINADHPETRAAQMPALGATNVIDSDAAANVVTYIHSWSDPTIGKGKRGAEILDVLEGEKTFKTVCGACHGADGTGNRALGAPNLRDREWLYGNDRATLFDTIWNGRSGLMPAWEGRLSNADRKILALYVLSLSAPKK